MAAPTKAEIRTEAMEIVRYYTARVELSHKAAVRKGQKRHLDPNLEPDDGYWVDCKVFVPRDNFGRGR